jgi:hypothetical protein
MQKPKSHKNLEKSTRIVITLHANNPHRTPIGSKSIQSLMYEQEKMAAPSTTIS